MRLGSQVLVEAVGVGHGHLLDGFSVGNSGSFHESAGCSWDSFALPCILCGSIVFNVADHQPQRLERGLMGGVLHPITGGFSQCIVEYFN